MLKRLQDRRRKTEEKNERAVGVRGDADVSILDEASGEHRAQPSPRFRSARAATNSPTFERAPSDSPTRANLRARRRTAAEAPRRRAHDASRG